jgi:hypothetical protein
MTTLYALTPIGGGNTPIAKSSNPIDAEPIAKIDINPKTNIVQSPTVVNKSKDFELPKKTNNIDNLTKKNYVTNKVITPNMEPIKKDEIEPLRNNNVIPKDSTLTSKTEPIYKDDINSEDENLNISNDNKLTNSFNDLLSRMNNLNNDEEEN